MTQLVKTPTFPNNSALGEGIRVTLSGGYLVAAGSTTDELGTLNNRVLATDASAAVIPLLDAGVKPMVASGAISQWQTVYAAASGKIASSGTLIRGVAMEAASGDGAIIRVLTGMQSITGTVARSNLVQDTSQKYGIPLASLQATGTGAQLGATAGTPASALGLTIGTYGSATPLLVGEAASGNSKSNKGRFQFPLPIEYVDAGAITVRVRAKITGAVQVAQTIDVEAYKGDKGGGVGSDLCTTSAQTLTTSFADYDFTVTPTGLVAGDLLDIQITGAANDTGGTANKLVQIGSIEILTTVKG